MPKNLQAIIEIASKRAQIWVLAEFDKQNAIYLDNLYFYKNPTASEEDATISALEVDGVSVVGFTPNSESYLFAYQGMVGILTF